MMRRGNLTWLILAGAVLTVVLASASIVLFHSLETDRRAEESRQQRFMKTSASLVIDDLGAELFAMYSAFSFDLMRGRDAGLTLTQDSVATVIERYRSQARFPELLQEVLCLVKAVPEDQVLLWSTKGWQSVPLPSWAEGLPARTTSQVFSLEQPILLVPLRVRSPQAGELLAVALRFSSRLILEQVVPALVSQHFSESSEAQPYRATLHLRTDKSEQALPTDYEVPLLPWTPFEGWFDYYLARLRAMDGRSLPLPPATLEAGASGTRWSLAVSRLPRGLVAEMNEARGRNIVWALGFFLTLMTGLGGLTLVVDQLRRRAHLERTFLTLVSHELKTPLAVVQSLADNLAGGVTADAQRVKEYGRVLQNESRRLASMIGNVLSLTAAQGGFATRELGAIPLDELVRERVQRQPAAPVDVDVTVQIHPGTAPVRGHVGALSAAVDNLVGNAFRHGLSGAGPHWIRIRVEPRKRWGRRGTEFVIEDNGPGIHWLEGRVVGRAFRRGNNAEQNQIPGGGIGLSLVRTTARALGGRLDWEGRPGRGARFRLWLPEARS